VHASFRCSYEWRVPFSQRYVLCGSHRVGLYLGQCAQYCGTQHAKMLLRVHVDSREDFSRWIQEQQQPARIADKAPQGRRIFEQTAGVNCHTVAGTPANGTDGPDLMHLMSRQTIAAGAASNTLENFMAWIYNPSVIKPGCFAYLVPAAVVTIQMLSRRRRPSGVEVG